VSPLPSDDGRCPVVAAGASPEGRGGPEQGASGAEAVFRQQGLGGARGGGRVSLLPPVDGRCPVVAAGASPGGRGGPE
jgi:hypothetical protein